MHQWPKFANSPKIKLTQIKVLSSAIVLHTQLGLVDNIFGSVTELLENKDEPAAARGVCKISLSFRLSFSLSDMTNYESADF